MRGATARAIRRAIYEDYSPRLREYSQREHKKPTGKFDKKGKPIMMRVFEFAADERRQRYQRAKKEHLCQTRQ